VAISAKVVRTMLHAAGSTGADDDLQADQIQDYFDVPSIFYATRFARRRVEAQYENSCGVADVGGVRARAMRSAWSRTSAIIDKRRPSETFRSDERDRRREERTASSWRYGRHGEYSGQGRAGA